MPTDPPEKPQLLPDANLPDLDEATKAKIQKVIIQLADKDSEERKQFNEARQQWDDDVNEIVKQAKLSEQLTKDDLAIRINARD